MSYSSKVIWLIIISTLVAFSACAPTETVTTDEPVQEEPASQKYPSWFNSGGFSSDSLSYYGFGTAISSDSVIAIANANLKANAVLEDHIAELMEDVREDLEENGSGTASEAEFILALRNAHSNVEDASSSAEVSTKIEEEGYYRGYSKVAISKRELYNLLQSGFQENPNFWEILESAESFQAIFE